MTTQAESLRAALEFKANHPLTGLVAGAVVITPKEARYLAARLALTPLLPGLSGLRAAATAWHDAFRDGLLKGVSSCACARGTGEMCGLGAALTPPTEGLCECGTGSIEEHDDAVAAMEEPIP